MLKIIVAALFKFRDSLQNLMGSWLGRLRDSNGKFKFVKPSTFKKLITIIPIIIFLLIILSKVFTDSNKVTGGLEEFEKEHKPNSGVSSRDIRQGGLEVDPFKGIGAISRDQFGASTNIGGSGVTGITTGPSTPECAAILEKLKTNAALTTEERQLVDSCIESNVLGLTQEELEIMRMMADPNTTEAERALLAKVLNNTATPEELAVAQALISGDALQREMAREAIRQGDAAITALGKSLDGRPLTAEEQALLARIRERAEQNVAAGGATGTVIGADGSVIKTDPSLSPEALNTLAQEIANREVDIERLQGEVDSEQLRISPLLEAMASGRTLTPAETKRVQDFMAKKAQLDALKAQQAAKKTEFAGKASQVQKNLARALTTVRQTIPSGSFIEYEGETVDCSKVAALPTKKRPRGPRKSQTVVDVDGRPLRPEEIEFIKLSRKNQMEIAQAKKDISDPLGTLGTPFNVASMGDQAVGIQDLQSLVVFKDSSLKTFELGPDMRIPAVLESQILVSDKGKGQMVRVRILDDVYNPKSREIVIPKGSVAVAQTSGFDADTGKMDLAFDRVMIGSGKSISVRFSIGSADGSMGLSGQVRDTRGKYLLGAFITSFSAGALGWFSQQVVAPFQQSTNAGEAMSGAGLAGGAEVLNRISEIYASDLQNAAKIFWVPKGVPIVLYPN